MDLLAESAGCPFISDLRHITGKERLRLADKLEEILPSAYPLPVWNDALAYLISAPPQQTSEEARRRLLHHYRNQEDDPLSNSPKGGNEYENE